MLSSKIAKTVPEIETCQQCIKVADEIQYREIPNYALVVKEKYQLHQWNDELVTQLSNKQLIHTGATKASYLSRKKKEVKEILEILLFSESFTLSLMKYLL